MTIEEWLGEDNILGIDIWKNKYRENDESFDEWLDRVSGGNYELKMLILDQKFLFGGRTLSNRGTNKKGSFSNCYSRGFVEDNLEDLMQANTDIAKTFKAQGGQGISLSKIRPKGCDINGGQFKSDGIIPFMEIYNRTTQSISQGGSRKGALIMSLDIWHKEAEDFIKIKSENAERINKANLSLEIDDNFMECVHDYYVHGLERVVKVEKEYEGNKIEYEVTPIKLYKLMMQKAYDWAEPGCIFTDRFRNYNLMQFCDDYQIETCNPCGEQPLPKHGACNLGSLNLSKFVKYSFEKAAYFDFKDFRRAVKIAVEALDTVVDENVKNHPLKEQAEMAKNYRNIGLGIMGLHDMLIKMGYTYGSGHSLNIIHDIMYTMFDEAVKTSAILAAKKGTFPAYNENVLKSEILNSQVEEETLELVEKYGLRNCSLISIAPTGSIGSLLDVSTGCEPFYDFSYIRKTESLNGEEPKYYKVDSGIVKEYRKITKTKDEPLPEYFITASQIHWKDRIAIQSIMQNYVDTAISSTINLPKETTLAEIEALYLEAWLSGLKGVTIYRDGCKREGILSKEGKKEVSSNKNKNTLERGYVVPSNDNVIGLKKTLKTGCGTLHCKVFFDADTNDLTEIYLSKGSTGGCNNFMVGLSRMISMSARAGVSVVDIVDQLMSAGTCPSYYVRKKTKKDTSKGSSCPVAVGYAIKELWEEFQGKELKPKDIEEEKIQEEVNEKPTCPQCGAPIVFEGGCNTCRSCGWSKCE